MDFGPFGRVRAGPAWVEAEEDAPAGLGGNDADQQHRTIVGERYPVRANHLGLHRRRPGHSKRRAMHTPGPIASERSTQGAQLEAIASELSSLSAEPAVSDRPLRRTTPSMTKCNAWTFCGESTERRGHREQRPMSSMFCHPGFGRAPNPACDRQRICLISRHEGLRANASVQRRGQRTTYVRFSSPPRGALFLSACLSEHFGDGGVVSRYRIS